MQMGRLEIYGHLYERVEPMKTVRLSAVIFEMLRVLAKKRRQKPDECLATIIEREFGAKK